MCKLVQLCELIRVEIAVVLCHRPPTPFACLLNMFRVKPLQSFTRELRVPREHRAEQDAALEWFALRLAKANMTGTGLLKSQPRDFEARRRALVRGISRASSAPCLARLGGR